MGWKKTAGVGLKGGGVYFLADDVSICNKQQGAAPPPQPLHIMMNELHISQHLRDLFILGYYGDGSPPCGGEGWW